MSSPRNRRKDAIYNGIALTAVGVISLLFAGVQGSEAARLAGDRIATQGIVIRKLRTRRASDGTSHAARIIEVRYLDEATSINAGVLSPEATNSLFDQPHPTSPQSRERDRRLPNRDLPTDFAARSADASPSATDQDIYQTMQIEVLSASLFDRLQTGMAVDFSYCSSDPHTARLSEEQSLWQPPLWQYGIMGVTFGGAAYFFLKAIFMRREAARRGRSPRQASR